jgi:hypothetical protein
MAHVNVPFGCVVTWAEATAAEAARAMTEVLMMAVPWMVLIQVICLYLQGA